jgi:hypothetical protein
MVQDLVGRLMADMDPKLLTFLRTKVDSFVKWDLIRFYYENPHTTDTAQNIARYTGRDVETVQEELNDLVDYGVLIEHHVDHVTIYSLSDDPDTRQVIHRFFEACRDRHFRTKAIYHIIRNMR